MTPLSIIAILFDRTSASSILCVVRMKEELNFLLTLFITFHDSLRVSGSIPEVGSSNNINYGLPNRAIAKLNFR